MPKVAARASKDIVIAPGESITVFCQTSATVTRRSPEPVIVLGTVNSGSTTFGPFAGGATVSVAAGDSTAYFAVGASPVLKELIRYWIQPAPSSINSSGAITVTALINGVINATAGLLGLNGSLPTGTELDRSSDFRVDDAFDWHVISIGPGTYTVSASAGHTLVGPGGVGSSQSAMFRTRKTAANTFVTYRLA